MTKMMKRPVARVPVFKAGGDIVDWVSASVTSIGASKVAGAPVFWAKHPFGMYGWRTASWKVMKLVAAKPVGVPVGALLVK